MQVTALLNRVSGAARPDRSQAKARAAATARGLLDRRETRVAGESAPAGERARVRAVLVEARTELARGYLRRALAAGHPVATLERFGAQLRSLPDPELRRRLQLVDPRRPGRVQLGTVRVAQIDGTTCGPMTILIARSLTDPVYAWWLTGAPDVAERLAAEQRRIHRATNPVWPRRLGTTPWGLADTLTAHGRGVRYGWWMVDDTDPGSVEPALRDAVAAVGAGYPVPVLLGARVPRHWVLLLAAAAEGAGLVFYNPAGTVVRLDRASFLGGRMSPLGYPHAQAVVLPAG